MGTSRLSALWPEGQEQTEEAHHLEELWHGERRAESPVHELRLPLRPVVELGDRGPGNQPRPPPGAEVHGLRLALPHAGHDRSANRRDPRDETGAVPGDPRRQRPAVEPRHERGGCVRVVRHPGAAQTGLGTTMPITRYEQRIARRGQPSSMSQTTTVGLSPPAAAVMPSLLHATEWIAPICQSQASSEVPVRTFQRRTSRSAPPERSRWPSGENAIVRTSARRPRSSSS